MGVVYEAIQDQPRRVVALKVMKPDLVSRSALRRFEYESQLLARLRHPNIAQIYEAGTHGEGDKAVPFFAMEYIPNARPVTEHARRMKLATRDRLALFAKVCDAVHHGHLKGIIHRDLKPGNILVDSSGEPKVIDFGVARAIDADMAATTLQTGVGQLIGTLQYMSPEQCEADPHAIDTRSDVYALGVVLYELLCGSLPYDLSQKPVLDAVRAIREDTPARPSTFDRTLRGDVETIILKSLEKDRERRYPSAEALMSDIHRYLRHEPIMARPPSVRYQFRKFARRNRAAVIGAAAVFVALLAGAIVSLVFAVGQAQARRESERREVDARVAQQEAVRQMKIAQAINDFLNEDLLGAASPQELGATASIIEVLNAASDNVQGRFEDEPLVEAGVRSTLGNTYASLGEYSSAEPHLIESLRLARERLGNDHAETARSMNDLAVLYQLQGRYDEAEPLHLEALDTQRSLTGDEDPDTLVYMSDLGAVYFYQSRYDEAVPLCVRTLKLRRRLLGNDDPETHETMNVLAVIYTQMGRFEDAEPLFVETLTTARRTRGEDHPDTLQAMANLGSMYDSARRFDDAEPLMIKSLELRRRVLGDDHPETLFSIANLGLLYLKLDRYDHAEPLLVESLESRRRVLGTAHPDTATSLNNLAGFYTRQKLYDQAQPLLADLVTAWRDALGSRHVYVGIGLANYGSCLTHLQRFEEAEPALLEAHEIFLARVGADHARTLDSIKYLVNLYDAWSKADEAAVWRAKQPVSGVANTGE